MEAQIKSPHAKDSMGNANCNDRLVYHRDCARLLHCD